MGFCKPGDPCFGVLGGFSLQRILDYQQEGRQKAEDCGIDASSLDFCTQINNCITGSSIHTSLTACTIWNDMIVPCETGTTVDGLLQVVGSMSAQTDLLVGGLIRGYTDLALGTAGYTDSTISAEESLTLKGRRVDNDFMRLGQDRFQFYLDGSEFATFTSLTHPSADAGIMFNTSSQDYNFKIVGATGSASTIFQASASDYGVRIREHLIIGNADFIPWSDFQTWGFAVTGSSLLVSGGTNLLNYNAVEARGNALIKGNLTVSSENIIGGGNAYITDTLFSDMIAPYATGTTINGLLQVTGAISAQTDTYVHGHIYSGTTNLLDIFCAKPCGSGGGGGVGLNDGYWSANTAGGISNSGGTRVGIGTTTPSSIFEVYNYLKFPAVNDVYMGRYSGLNWEATSHSNTAMGALTMGSATLNGAIVNTAVGLGALGFITTGDYNTALGGQAHQGITTGEGNVSVGYLSQFTNTTNNYSTSVGMNTMRYTVNLGTGALMGDSYNTAVGYSSQYYSISGMFNTSLGAKTIGNGSISIGSTGNTAVGFEAMNKSQQGSFNTAVGYQAGYGITTGKFNIAIGNTADVGDVGGNYQLNIGNIIYGQDSYDDDAISQIGINTSSPNRTLTVVGSISGTSNLDVGETLTVTGATRLHSSLRMTDGQYFFPDDGTTETFIRGTGDDLYIAADDDLFLAPDDDLQILVGASAYAQFDGGTTSLNVGVGATPTARIESSGALNAGTTFWPLGQEEEPSCLAVANFYQGMSLSIEESNLFISELVADGSGDIFLYAGPTIAKAEVNLDLVLGAFTSGADCSREIMRLDGATGLVGVNNASPTRQLDVTGSIGATTVVAATISATTEFRIHTGNPAGGATVSPNIYWFANCDAQSFGPASDGSFPSTNTTDVSWGETHNSHAGVYSFSAEELTIKRAGLYRITYNVTLEGGADGTTSNRTGGGIALLVNGAVVNGTESYTYNRLANIERNTGTTSVIYNVTANDVFKIVFIRTGAQSASSKLGTITAGTSWTVEAVT